MPNYILILLFQYLQPHAISLRTHATRIRFSPLAAFLFQHLFDYSTSTATVSSRPLLRHIAPCHFPHQKGACLPGQEYAGFAGASPPLKLPYLAGRRASRRAVSSKQAFRLRPTANTTTTTSILIYYAFSKYLSHWHLRLSMSDDIYHFRRGLFRSLI